MLASDLIASVGWILAVPTATNASRPSRWEPRVNWGRMHGLRMVQKLLTKFVSLLLATVMASPLYAAAQGFACADCGESGAKASILEVVGDGEEAGSSTEICCSCAGRASGSRDQDEGGGCRDCGCPECAVHVVAVGIMWGGEGAVPATLACELGTARPGIAPAHVDVSDLMRPPRTMTA